MPIGTLVLPNPADVRVGVQYGADGTEYTGTLRVPVASSTGTGRYSIDEALRAKLLSITGVSSRIGDRLYPDDAAPQTPEFPYGVLTMIGDATRFRKLRGSPNKTLRARYQVDFYSKRRADVRGAMAAATSTADDGGIDGMQDVIGDSDTGCYVQSCLVENLRHSSEPPQSAGEARIYNAGFDAVIVFNE